MGRIFGRKKKTEDRKAVEFCEGVRLLNDPEITDGGREGADYRKGKLRRRKSDSRGIAAKCLLEIFIIGGSMCGFLSCIDMAYGVPVIFLAYALLAMYFCGLFKSGKVWVRDVGYVIFLVAFVLFIMLLRRYINSGFYAIVNEFLDHVTDYYGAQEVKVFSETLSNRALTVPVAAIAIGCVEIIILNIFLNTNMSVFWAVWFSLPVFILPLFFRLEPDVIYMFMVSTGLLGVICLKGNGHFRITDKDSTLNMMRRSEDSVTGIVTGRLCSLRPVWRLYVYWWEVRLSLSSRSRLICTGIVIARRRTRSKARLETSSCMDLNP